MIILSVITQTVQVIYMITLSMITQTVQVVVCSTEHIALGDQRPQFVQLCTPSATHRRFALADGRVEQLFVVNFCERSVDGPLQEGFVGDGQKSVQCLGRKSGGIGKMEKIRD